MDLTQYKFNLSKSPYDHRDFMVESIYPDAVILPEVYDLRPQMRPIRDQGQQGTCSAQTAAAMKEWEELTDVGFKEYMSPQFVYNLRPNQESEGMTPRDTMDILFKIGIVSEKAYTYGTFSAIPDELKMQAAKYKIQGYAQINTLDALKKALFANGPCYFGFYVYDPNSMEFWKQQNPNQPALGGHAVCCCGWLKDCFIIRNSWTAQWGDQGYCFYPFNQWGHHFECWSALDADSHMSGLKKKIEAQSKKSLLKRLFTCKFKK